MSEVNDFVSKVSVLRTEYLTDDMDHPKESINLYSHFKYYKHGGRTDSLWHSLIVRQKSKIVYREDKLEDGFYFALIRYCRVLRQRAQEWHILATMINTVLDSQEPTEA